MLEQREKYVRAWNDTMCKIWKERIIKFNAVRTGALLSSITVLPVRADGRFWDVTLQHTFLTYGLYVNYGTGREVFRGNGGDIGRDKNRVAKPWFSKAHYASYMKLREFYSDQAAQEAEQLIINRLTTSI